MYICIYVCIQYKSGRNSKVGVGVGGVGVGVVVGIAVRSRME